MSTTGALVFRNSRKDMTNSSHPTELQNKATKTHYVLYFSTPDDPSSQDRIMFKGSMCMWLNHCKGRMAAPNQMNFRKSSKGGGRIFNPKIHIADFEPLNRAFSE